MERVEKYALDTDFLVEFLRGRSPAVTLMAKLRESGYLATTVINAFELYWGAYKFNGKRAEDVRKLLRRMVVLNMDERIAEKAGEEIAYLEQMGLPVDVRDLFTGVISREHGYAIITGNEEHFKRIRGLSVINWRSLEPDARP
ncbi:MAG: hypothetical protein B7L53_06675 [Thermofilum sp. NZ13]|nr:MAG: hypothetical protein B7L53_06675 [Thermofilum sp. NZ13]